MKKGMIVGLIVLGVIIVLIASIASSYNGLVEKQEGVSGQWANVESQYQRRADLIPNLVETVKGYATHENETLTGVMEARAKATQMNISFDQLDEQTMARYQQAQGELSSALNRLMAVSEAYPDLRANQNFMALQDQLEGTENRIATERMRFNDMVKEYNVSLRQFPRSIIAGMFGFTPKAFFAAEAGSEKAPEVKF